MKQTFDFDTIVNRHDSGSYKWDTNPDENTLPMWVADMDFRTAPAIIDALRRRVEHGVFGYTHIGKAYYDAVIRWFDKRHGWRIDPEWFIYTSGVVPAISAIIKAATEPGDSVITQTPAYNCFFSSIRNNGCRLSANNLLYDHGRYTIDFDDLELRAADPRARVLLLCNPHNPSGRVWTRDELLHVGDICLRNNVLIVSDEIHCELTYPPYVYTPFGTLGEELRMNSVSCISPSKAFNIAGLQIANIVTANPTLRQRIDRAININEVCDVNPFGIEATIAAYNLSGAWLDALIAYLRDNYILLRDHLNHTLPRLTIVPLEATYLAWVDIRPTGLSDQAIADLLQEDSHLRVNPGSMYGPGGEGFIRINLAAPRQVIAEAAQRISATLQSLLS